MGEALKLEPPIDSAKALTDRLAEAFPGEQLLLPAHLEPLAGRLELESRPLNRAPGQTSTTPSISTAMLNGRDCMPTADRAGRPASP